MDSAVCYNSGNNALYKRGISLKVLMGIKTW